MPDVPITLTVWRDAKTDPPRPDTFQDYWTDQGSVIAWHDGGWGNCELPDEWMPRVWCEPSPPGDDALTLAHLQRAHDALLYASGNPDHGILTVVYPEECEAAAAHLRRALDQIEATP